MERVLAPFGRRRAPVTESRLLGGYRLISVQDAGGPVPHGGQFYMLATAERWGADGGRTGRPFLPRAVSVGTVDGADDQIELGFLLEDVGPGTHRLMEAQPGEELLVAGPFGRGFSDPTQLAGESAVPLLVAGGVGAPPIAIWESQLRGRGADPIVMAGFRSGEFAEGVRIFKGPVRIATDDGGGEDKGLGEVHRGPVTDLLERGLDEHGPAAVYACGPPAMLEAVRALCAGRGVAAELAMEAGMACGFGACFGCAVETESGYMRLCLDGPVVNAAALTSALPSRAEVRTEDAIGVGN